jgi:hypothetical protein
LLLAKGVQTEGDARRAWDALIGSLASPTVVAQRLAQIAKMNERNATTLARVVQNRRVQRGLAPIDMAEWTDVPSILAIGAPLPAAAPPSGAPTPAAGVGGDRMAQLLARKAALTKKAP